MKPDTLSPLMITQAYERGQRDGINDPQECWLPPPEMKHDSCRDAWTKGYREEWAKRKGTT